MAPSGSKKRKIDEVDVGPPARANKNQPKSKAPPKGAPPPKTKAAAGRSTAAPKSNNASTSKLNNSKPPSSKPKSTQKDVQDAPVSVPSRSAQSAAKKSRVSEGSQTPIVLIDQSTAQRQVGSQGPRATPNTAASLPGQMTQSASKNRQASAGSQKGQATLKISASENVPGQSEHSERRQRSGSLQIGRDPLTTPTRASTIVPGQSAESSTHKHKISADLQNRPATSNTPAAAIVPNQSAQTSTDKRQVSTGSQNRKATPNEFATAAIIPGELVQSSLNKHEVSVSPTPTRIQNSFTGEHGRGSALSFSNIPPVQDSMSQPQEEQSFTHGNFDPRNSRPEQLHSKGSRPQVTSSEDIAATDPGVRVQQNSPNRNPQAMNMPNQVANSPHSFSTPVLQSDPRINNAAAGTMQNIPPPRIPVVSLRSQREIHPHPTTPQYFPPITQNKSSVTRIDNAAQGTVISGMLPSKSPLTVGNNRPANPAQLVSNQIHQTASPLRDPVLKGIMQGAEGPGTNLPNRLGIYPQSFLHNGQQLSLNIRHQAEGVSTGSMNVLSQLGFSSQPFPHAAQQPSSNTRHQAPNFIMQDIQASGMNVPNQLGVSPQSQNWDQVLNDHNQSGHSAEAYRDPAAFRELFQKLKTRGHGRARASDGTNRLATISLDDINRFVREYARYLRSKLKDGVSDGNNLAESRNNVLAMLKKWHGVDTIKYTEYDLETFAAKGLDVGFAIAVIACNDGFTGILNHVCSMFQSLADTACQQLAVMERDPIQTQEETRKWRKTSWYYIEKVEFHFCRMAKERISEVMQEYSMRRQRQELQALQAHQPVQNKWEAPVLQPDPTSQAVKDGSPGEEENVQAQMEQSENNDIMEMDVDKEVAAVDKEATAVDEETMEVVKEPVNAAPSVTQFADGSLALSRGATT